MTPEALKTAISESKHPSWFENLSMTFAFKTNDPIIFVGIYPAYEYIASQCNLWQESENELKQQNHNIPNIFQVCKNAFATIQNLISNFVNTHKIHEENALNAHWKNSLKQINHQALQTFPANSLEFLFLKKVLSKKSNDHFEGAYSFIFKQNEQISTNDRLYGAFMAYEFLAKDNDNRLFERTEIEYDSLKKMQKFVGQYTSHITKSYNDSIEQNSKAYAERIDAIDNIKEAMEKEFATLQAVKEKELTDLKVVNEREFAELKSVKEKEFTYLKQAKEKELGDLFETQKTEWQTWFDSTKANTWGKWHDDAQARVKALEDLYQNKLKLAEPANYWEKRGKQLKTQGWVALAVTALLVGFSCYSLYSLLWYSPEQMLASWLGEDKSAAIRWTIVYITFLSFVAFCIRALTKFMFSSFHLARDSEERHTLTFFYLSLLKDAKVDEKDRQLIIQSLFSRADTGLLKDDSSPTMPNANEVINKSIGGKD